MKKHVSFAILQVPVTAVQSGSTLPANSDIELKLVPIGTTNIFSGFSATFYRYRDFAVISNAAQTVYLTGTNPVEFVYVDSSFDRSFNVISIQPKIINRKHPGYYLFLPITVPADIATSPFQAIGFLWFWLLLGHGQC